MRDGSRNHAAMQSNEPRLTAFLDRCRRAAERLKISQARLSTILFKDGKRLDQLASGESDIGILRLSRAERALSEMEGQTPTPSAIARSASRERAA